LGSYTPAGDVPAAPTVDIQETENPDVCEVVIALPTQRDGGGELRGTVRGEGVIIQADAREAAAYVEDFEAAYFRPDAQPFSFEDVDKSVSVTIPFKRVDKDRPYSAVVRCTV